MFHLYETSTIIISICNIAMSNKWSYSIHINNINNNPYTKTFLVNHPKNNMQWNISLPHIYVNFQNVNHNNCNSIINVNRV